MTDPPWLTPEEMHAWIRLVSVVELLPGALDAPLQRDAGVTHFEYFTLARLSEAPDRRLRMTALSAATNSSLARLSHVISRLEKRGFVERSPCGRSPSHQCLPHGDGLAEGGRHSARSRRDSARQCDRCSGCRRHRRPRPHHGAHPLEARSGGSPAGLGRRVARDRPRALPPENGTEAGGVPDRTAPASPVEDHDHPKIELLCPGLPKPFT
jgi:hypothetical protein